MGKAWEAATEYFRCMRNSDATGIEKLFAADSVLTIFDGTVRRGRDDIRDFYEHTAMWPGLRPKPQLPVEQGDRCAVEILIRRRDESVMRVADVFTVNDAGEIASLRIYKGHLLDGDLELLTD
jgi:SnoaL-like domain